MLTGAAVYNEGAGRRAGKCRQACRNNDLRLVKRKHANGRKHYTLPLSAISKYYFYITKFKYHLCYYLNLIAILAKGTAR
jgi:hypothetical protein